MYLFMNPFMYCKKIPYYVSKKQQKQHLIPSKFVLHEQFLIWICLNNTSLSHLLSFRHTAVNTPENPLCRRWNQEGKQQEMLYIEQITRSILFISLLVSFYDIFQPYWTLWHCEKYKIQFDASFSVTPQLRCDPHVCSNSMWERRIMRKG